MKTTELKKKKRNNIIKTATDCSQLRSPSLQEDQLATVYRQDTRPWKWGCSIPSDPRNWSGWEKQLTLTAFSLPQARTALPYIESTPPPPKAYGFSSGNRKAPDGHSAPWVLWVLFQEAHFGVTSQGSQGKICRAWPLEIRLWCREEQGLQQQGLLVDQVPSHSSAWLEIPPTAHLQSQAIDPIWLGKVVCGSVWFRIQSHESSWAWSLCCHTTPARKLTHSPTHC